MIRFAHFGLFSVTHASIPEASKILMEARLESIRWQIGSVISTMIEHDCVHKKVLFKAGNFLRHQEQHWKLLETPVVPENILKKYNCKEYLSGLRNALNKESLKS